MEGALGGGNARWWWEGGALPHCLPQDWLAGFIKKYLPVVWTSVQSLFATMTVPGGATSPSHDPCPHLGRGWWGLPGRSQTLVQSSWAGLAEGGTGSGVSL